MNELLEKTTTPFDSIFHLPQAPASINPRVFVAKTRGSRRQDAFLYENPRENIFHTGFVELDRLLGGGFHPGTINGIVGLPRTGKSSLAEHIANRYPSVISRTEINEVYPSLMGFDFYLVSCGGIKENDVEELDRRGNVLARGNGHPPFETYGNGTFRSNFIRRMRSIAARNNAFCLYTMGLRWLINTGRIARSKPSSLACMSDSIIQTHSMTSVTVLKSRLGIGTPKVTLDWKR